MFLHTFHPAPIIFQFGFLKIYWYGFIIALAVLVGLMVAIKLNKKYQEKNIIVFKNKDQIFDLCFCLVIFGLIGARIYEVFLFLPFYIKDPLAIFKIWNGGLAIHGAILGGVLAILIFARRHKTDLSLSFDLIAPAVALGQAIGRWGNYFNQELFGLPTRLPWGIPIDLIHRPIGYENFNFFHPTFLYESLLSLALSGVLIFLHCRRLAKIYSTPKETQKSVAPLTRGDGGFDESPTSINNPHPNPPQGEGEHTPPPWRGLGGGFETKILTQSCGDFSPRGSLPLGDSREELKYQKGNIVLFYLIGYSIIRFSLEFIKIDETPSTLELRWPQVISLALIVLAGFIFFKKRKVIKNEVK